MSPITPILKKPKLEQGHDDDDGELVRRRHNKSPVKEQNGGGGGAEFDDNEETTDDEEESALVALIEHRTREVEHLKKRIDYYTSQLEDAERKLQTSKSQLARLKRGTMPQKTSLQYDTKRLKMGNSLTSSIRVNEISSGNQTQTRTELVIPAATPKTLQSGGSGARISIHSSAQTCSSNRTDTVSKVKAEKSDRSRTVENQDKGIKRRREQKEHTELIPMVCRNSSPQTIYCHANNHISSQHKRKLRSLVLCPVNDQLFVTSALDGLVNLWQLQSSSSSASLLNTTECISPKTRRWPEDIAWHPSGNSLVATYTADSGDSQIAIIDLNNKHEKSRVTFLQEKPHVKGIVNGVMFMPWGDPFFVTSGSDHAVVAWNEDSEKSWKPKALHRNLHSSAVMGAAGMHHKQIVLSAGADKRIIGFDVQAGRVELKHQVDSKCMSVLPNPADFNLYMVQTGPDEGQYQQQQCAPPFNSHGTRNHLGNSAAVSDAPFAVQNNMQPQHDYCRTAENGVSAHFSNMHDQRFQFSHTHTPAVSDAQYSVQMDEGRQYGYYTHQSVEQHRQPAPTLPYPYNPSDATTQHGYVQPAINTETIEHRVQQPQKASSQQHFYPSSLTQYKYPQGQQGYPDSAVIQQPEAPVDPHYRNGAGGVAVAETIPNYQQHYDWSNQENYGYPQSQGNNVYELQQGNTLDQQYIQYTQPHQQGVVAQTLITASQSGENSHISSVSYQQYRPS